MKRRLVLMTSALMAIGLLAGCSHNHDWGEVSYVWSEDNKTCTATRVCKGDETHKETETVNSVYAVVTEAKCEVDGKGKFTVTFTNEAFLTQSKEVAIAAPGHKWALPSYDWSEDFSKCTAKRVCENDAAHVESETVDSEWVVVTPAECEVAGVGKFVATFQNEAFAEQKIENVVIPATDHHWGEPTYLWSEDNKTCTATRICENDPTHIETEISQSQWVVVTPATCEEAGVGKFVAPFRNEAFAEQVKDNIAIEALDHDYQFDSFVWSEKLDSAQAKYVCAHDAKHVELHDAEVVHEHTPAGCTEDGKDVFTATYEEHSETKEIAIKAHGHGYTDPTYEWSQDNKTCTATRVCAYDESHVETEIAQAQWVVVTPATCEQAGVGKFVASFRNQAFQEQAKENIAIDAFGHDYQFDSFVWSEKWDSAQAKYVCSRDAEHVEYHDAVVTINTVQSTCEDTGKMTFTATYDNHTDTKESVIPAKGHNWGDPTYEWSDDYAKCTATRVCGNDDSHVETETVDASLEVGIEPTCENDGSGTRFASFSNSAFSTQSKDVVLPHGHLYVFDSFVWDGFKAQAKYICSRDAEHIAYYDATVTNKVTKKALCESDGVRTYTASYDGHTDTKTEVISAIGHSWGTVSYSWSGDYKKCTATRICNNDRSHKETETVDTVALITGVPNRYVDGSIQFTATFENEAFPESVKQIKIPRMNLTQGHYVVENNQNRQGDLVGELYIPAEVDGKPVEILGGGCFANDWNITRVYIPESITSIEDSVFDSNTSLKELYYGGTIEQWNAISKEDGWNENMGTSVVHCSDGDFDWNAPSGGDEDPWDDVDPWDDEDPWDDGEDW